MSFDHVGIETVPPNALVGRRHMLKLGAVGIAALGVAGFVGTPRARTAVGALDRLASSQPDLAIQIFQTAASLENVSVAAYSSALQLPDVQEHATIGRLVESMVLHHTEHGAVFNAQVEALGGVRQDAPNPRYAQLVEDSKPTWTGVGGFVRLAALLEEVATDTYLENVALLTEPTMRVLMASVLGVEAQHLAVLRTVETLLAAGRAELVSTPTVVEQLPASIGSVAVPEPFEKPNLASPPVEGAVQ